MIRFNYSNEITSCSHNFSAVSAALMLLQAGLYLEVELVTSTIAPGPQRADICFQVTRMALGAVGQNDYLTFFEASPEL